MQVASFLSSLGVTADTYQLLIVTGIFVPAGLHWAMRGGFDGTFVSCTSLDLRKTGNLFARVHDGTSRVFVLRRCDPVDMTADLSDRFHHASLGPHSKVQEVAPVTSRRPKCRLAVEDCRYSSIDDGVEDIESATAIQFWVPAWYLQPLVKRSSPAWLLRSWLPDVGRAVSWEWFEDITLLEMVATLKLMASMGVECVTIDALFRGSLTACVRLLDLEVWRMRGVLGSVAVMALCAYRFKFRLLFLRSWSKNQISGLQ